MRLNRAKSLFLALCLGLCMVSGCQAADTGKPVDPATTRLDLGTIFLHVQEVMNLKEEADHVFVRWERPVRYYLQGLEKHPELERMFEEQIREIAKITGLDIKRHDDLYLEYKDPAKRQVGPDGLSSNAAIFFAENMEDGFQHVKVVRILRGFGDDPEREFNFWKNNNKGRNAGDLVFSKHGISERGLKLYLTIENVSYFQGLLNKDETLSKCQLLMKSILLAGIFRSGQKISSILNADSCVLGPGKLTVFDKAFFKVYYGDLIKSGITKRDAALKITEVLADEFNK